MPVIAMYPQKKPDEMWKLVISDLFDNTNIDAQTTGNLNKLIMGGLHSSDVLWFFKSGITTADSFSPIRITGYYSFPNIITVT